MNKKQAIIDALYIFVRQRSGMDWRNYGDVTSYRAEQRQITKDGAEAKRLIREVELHDSISADDIVSASRHAFSGRLSIVVHEGDRVTIDYCTGQYFPTEYRKAVCAVMANVLWNWVRDKCMLAPLTVEGPHSGATTYLWRDTQEAVSAGVWLRRHFRREFGRSMQARWFD
jgi:D-tyrosyl-tRNA(Tyr) deacylase